jgi:Mor family transcriptional regulator
MLCCVMGNGHSGQAFIFAVKKKICSRYWLQISMFKYIGGKEYYFPDEHA